MITLETINLFLDILVKLVFLLMIAFGIMILKKLNEVLEKAEESAESIEHTAETVERLIGIADFLPFIGSKRKEFEEELEEEVEDRDE